MSPAEPGCAMPRPGTVLRSELSNGVTILANGPCLRYPKRYVSDIFIKTTLSQFMQLDADVECANSSKSNAKRLSRADRRDLEGAEEKATCLYDL